MGVMIILFTLAMIIVFFKMMMLSVKACWGISKFLVCLIALPLILIGFALAGLIIVAIPILAIIGLVVLLKRVAIWSKYYKTPIRFFHIKLLPFQKGPPIFIAISVVLFIFLFTDHTHSWSISDCYSGTGNTRVCPAYPP